MAFQQEQNLKTDDREVGNKELGRRGWLALAAFGALSVPLAFLPPQVLVTTSEKQVVSAISAPAATPSVAKIATAPERRIVVSIPDRKLAVVEHGRVKKLYRVAVGTKWSPSPAGEFHIVNKVAAPVYRHKGKVVAAGSGNPLGSRWMGLDAPHYGIHGTNQPSSIGRAASHDCIRMASRDVQELFAVAQVGDAVEIHDQRTAELARIFAPENAGQHNSAQGE